MKIQIYQLIYNDWKNVNQDWLYKEMRILPIQEDVAQWEYGFINIQNEKNYIFGYIGQESNEELIRYNKAKELEEIDSYRWVNTFFALDCSSGKFFIHKRKYSPTNLHHSKTIDRANILFSKIFFNKFNVTVDLFSYRVGVSKNEFKEIFYTNQVLEVGFSDIYGNYVSTDADLHNPRKEWDRYRAESHNTYDAKIIRSAYLHAKESKDLSKSPTARTFLESGATGEKITYRNQTGELITEHKETKASFELKLDDRPDNYDITDLFEPIKRYILRKKDEFKNLKLFDDVDNILGLGDEDDRENKNNN